MKNLITLMGLLVAANSFATNLVDVKIQNIFTVARGFDSNDNVQVVIDGELPSICYYVNKPKVLFDKVSKTITISQTGKMANISSCTSGTEDYLNHPVNYNHVVNLGQMIPGNYEVKYIKNGQMTATSSFNVARASNKDVDSSIYAPISSAYTPELVYSDSPVTLVMSGILTSNCFLFNNSMVETQRIGNTFIVMPKLALRHEDCSQAQSPINAVVTLGTLNPGKYLIHIRSMSGKSINRVITVVKNNADFSPHPLR